MTRINDLIHELSPAGVSFQALSDVTDRISNIKWADSGNKKFQYIDLTSVDRVTHKIGETVTISAEDAPSRAQQIVREGDVIFATTRPTQMRWAVISAEYDGQIASTGYCVLRPVQNQVMTNFLAHVLGTERFRMYVEDKQIPGNYPSIPDRLVRGFTIPVPPLEVQREIVRILDTFSKLEAELEAELEARRKQYTFYRNQLLMFPEGERQVNSVKMSELFSMRAGQHLAASEIVESPTELFRYPVYGGNGQRGFSKIKSHTGKLLLIGRQGALCGNVKRVSEDFYATEHAVVAAPTPDIDVDFAYYLLTMMNLNKYKSAGAQPGLAVSKVGEILVSIPPIDEQRQIASILDKFYTLVNDLNNGLPAELKARRQQYEYYRDRLLTFQEVQ